MKKYVLLTFAVFGIGGTQIYARNKVLYLKANGWTPILITEETEGEVCVRELLPYENCIVPELLRSPMLLTRKERTAVLDRMAEIIGEVNEETVIESNFIMATLWGELLAKKLGVKHLIFLIQEDYSLSDVRFMRYFDFKLRRGELAGNTPVAIPKLLESYRRIPDGTDTYLSAYCSNTVEDCDSVHDGCIAQADYHIGSIGRLNKPFVIPMVRDIVRYAQAHPDATFQLVLFGGTPDPEELETIRKTASEAANLSLYVTGAIFPVPKKLLDQMDVFVSSAGAAATSANLGYVTIVIDANDFEPIGVLGHTTNELVHRLPGTPHESTQKLLDDILLEHKYQKTAVETDDGKAYGAAFDKHMTFLRKSAAEKEYYPVQKVGPNMLSRAIYRWRNHEKRA